jgi:hypothetical protein
MQADLARAAGMAGALAAAAGWWGLDALLGQLAARAAAVTRPELHALMQARRPPAARPPSLLGPGAVRSRCLPGRGAAPPQARLRACRWAAPAHALLARRAWEAGRMAPSAHDGIRPHDPPAGRRMLLPVQGSPRQCRSTPAGTAT